MAAVDVPPIAMLNSAGEVPVEELARARGQCPVARTPEGYWYLTRMQEVQEALKDVETFVSSFREPGVRVPEEEKLLSEISVPRHGKVRRVVNAAIGAHRVPRMEPYVRDLAVELLTPILERGHGELVSELTGPLPVIVVSQFIGVPPEDHEQFRAWTDEVLEGTYTTRNRTERGEGLAGGHPEFAAYLDERIAEVRAAKEKPDCLLSRLVETEVDGTRLNDVEIRTQAFFLVISGNETTRHLIANSIEHLATDPTLLGRLQADPSLIPVAVEETLRMWSSVQVLLRDCRRETTVAGVPMVPGDKVVFGVASANRDESYFEDPDTFRLDRRSPRDHVAFGGGPHVCPGATLARLEARVVLEVFADMVGSIALAPDYVRTKAPAFWANGPVALPVTLTPR